MWTRSEGTAPAPRLGDPIEAQALIATYGQGREPSAVAGVGQVEHRSHAGRRGGRGRDQDGDGAAYEQLPRTLHVDEPSPHGGLVGRQRAAAHRGAWVACGRACAARGCVVVRDQRHECARDLGGAAARSRMWWCRSARASSPVACGRVVWCRWWCRVGVRGRCVVRLGGCGGSWRVGRGLREGGPPLAWRVGGSGCGVFAG